MNKKTAVVKILDDREFFLDMAYILKNIGYCSRKVFPRVRAKELYGVISDAYNINFDSNSFIMALVDKKSEYDWGGEYSGESAKLILVFDEELVFDATIRRGESFDDWDVLQVDENSVNRALLGDWLDEVKVLRQLVSEQVKVAIEKEERVRLRKERAEINANFNLGKFE